MIQIIDWDECDVPEDDIEEIVTAVLQLPETYEKAELEENEDSY